MLWKQLSPRYRKLLKNGQRGEAVVVNARADTSRSDPFGIFGWNVTIRVTYPDGTTADFERYVEAKSAKEISAGMVVPIRFDPEKRPRVEIDTGELRTRADEGALAAQAEDQVDPLGTEPLQPDDWSEPLQPDDWSEPLQPGD